MNTVYLVWEDAYPSDDNQYLIDVFEKREIADKFVSLQVQGEYWIEEREVRHDL